MPAGEPYRFSQQRMAAVVLTNVVFPVYTKRRYIRHYSPGKWWDSLYTWDSGFTGIGLAQLDVERAIDCLNAYTTKPGDPEAAFIQHGTPLPTQHYLFLELWNLTQSRALLEYFYPRLRQYHLFLAGRLGSSTTRAFKSGLLKTWDYFYNTGWDDYPPQVFMHKEKLAPRTATAIINSHLIRTARMLAQMARVLGAGQGRGGLRGGHRALERRLAEAFLGRRRRLLQLRAARRAGRGHGHSAARERRELQPRAGRRHAAAGGHLHARAGANLAGPPAVAAAALDAASACPPWTRARPTYRHDGYWNGAVWMPHQWFLWKTMLDLGQADFAFKIAQTALDLWKAEVDESYDCFEHFLIESGRGAGWHQFSALSSPVLAWFSAYYRPGRLTAGFDTWIHRCAFEPDHSALSAELELLGRSEAEATLLITLQPGWTYHAQWNGTRVSARPAPSGTLQIDLPRNSGRGTLRVEPV